MSFSKKPKRPAVGGRRPLLTEWQAYRLAEMAVLGPRNWMPHVDPKWTYHQDLKVLIEFGYAKVAGNRVEITQNGVRRLTEGE